MMDEKNMQMIMGLIMHSGDAKSHAMEAIQAAKANDFSAAEVSLNEAKESLIRAHQSQTEMLTKEAQGDPIEVTLLTVHSQDHLMTSISFTDLAKEMVDLYKVINGR